MAQQSRKIVCPHCDTVNRVASDKPANMAKCGHCHQRLLEGKPFPLSTRSFDRQIQYSDIPVVADFWAAWCGPCKAMAPIFERVAQELEPEARFVKIDTEAEQELASRYDIRAIPMVMIFRNGRVVSRRPGASDAASLRSWILENTRSSEAAAQ